MYPHKNDLTAANALVFGVAALMLVAGLVPATSAQGGQASASMPDQTSGGTTVTVASATLPEGGFLAIHDATLQDGAVLGSVRGASSFLEAGTHEDVTVRLDEPITEDTTLIAMPHKDTDGDRAYTFVSSGGSADGPYTSGGNAVVDDAAITASATVAISDQPTSGSTVIVDEVEMAEGGFVAIHDKRLLEGMPLASVIGVSGFLGPGPHEDLRVELDRELTQEQPVIAMPHVDSDDDKTYDFVTSGGQEDGPYKNASGKAVIDDATATPSDTATVSFDDQSTGGTNVVVASVYLPEGGFVTMHDSSLADGKTFDSVRGVSACLDPGIHREIRISLDDPLTSDDRLIAMPHLDSDDDCTYDFVDTQGEDDGPYTADGEIVTEGGQVTLSASVHAASQSSDGHTITIDSVDMVGGGFIAVHAPSLLAGEVTGSVVGTSKHLSPGPHEDVEVTFDEPLRASQTLIPMPHKDTDGDKTYDFVTSEGQDDGPYVDGAGKPVVDLTPTQILATVRFEPQSVVDSVSVASVTMHDGGFLTIHDDSLLDGKVFESVVGVSEALSPGTHEDVEVTIEDPPSGQATLIAMPHKDTDGDETYDFVDTNGKDDGPYTAAGGAVIDTASVEFPTADTGGDGPDGPGSDDGAGDGPGDGEQGAPGAAVLGALAALAVAALAGVARRKR